MKKLASGFLALVILLSIGASVATEKPLSSMKFKDCEISILGARMSKKGQQYVAKEAGGDRPVIVIDFEWSHSDKQDTKMFMTAFTIKAFQNGVELDTAIMIDEVDSSEHLRSIKDGVVRQVAEGYVLEDMSSPVEIEITKFFDLFSKDKLTYTFTFK